MQRLKITRRALLLIAATCLSAPLVRAEPTPRLLIVGDSWAENLWKAGAYQKIFEEQGIEDIGVRGKRTAIGGTTASMWNSWWMRRRVTKELDKHPTIDVVHLSLGGNDVLFWWAVHRAVEDLDKHMVKMEDELSTFIDWLLDERKNLRIVLCGYDYVNFIGDPESRINEWVYRSMGRPTPLEVNTLVQQIAAVQNALAQERERVYFVPNVGACQGVFGYPSLGISPEAVPGIEIHEDGSVTGGLENLPSPPEVMRRSMGRMDCIHLNAEGYGVLAERCYEQILRELLVGEAVHALE